MTRDRLRRVAAWAWTLARHPLTVDAALGACVQGPAHIRGKLRLGRGTVVFRGLDCVGPVQIGDRSFVNAYCYLRPGVVIGDRVAIASHVRLITDSHDIGGPGRRAVGTKSAPIVIGDGAWIGSGCVVLPGVTIGQGAVVAAGSIVTRDVEPNSLVAGAPAEQRRMLD